MNQGWMCLPGTEVLPRIAYHNGLDFACGLLQRKLIILLRQHMSAIITYKFRVRGRPSQNTTWRLFAEKVLEQFFFRPAPHHEPNGFDP